MRRAIAVGLVFSVSVLGGCLLGDGDSGDPEGSNNPDGGGGGGGGGCPGEQAISFGSQVQGTTASGWDEDLTDWFDESNVACAPATQSSEFPPPFAVYSLDMPESSDWDVVLRPEQGVDVTLIAYQQSSTDDSCYPTRGVGVVSCEESHEGGPGQPEVVRLNATTNPYKVVILVATPEGGTPGAFNLMVANHQ